MIIDFLQYIDVLIQIYRLSEKLDSAGDTLSRILGIAVGQPKNQSKAIENFRNWLLNFDIWGSFMPLTT
jgi:hypothetical protein